MRILVVADYYRHGEARVVENRAAALVRRGHAVALLAGADPERLEGEREAARAEGLDPELVPYTPGERGPWALLSLARAFHEAFRKRRAAGRFDAVLLNQPLSAWALLGAVRRQGARTLYTFHSPWAVEWAIGRGMELPEDLRCPGGWRARLEFTARRWIEGRVLSRCDRITVLSEYMRGQISRAHPRVDPSKVEIVPGGVELGRFRPSSPGARRARKAALGFSPDARLLLSVRRLVPRMGLENLLRAFSMLCRELPDLQLVIGGTGPLEGVLRATARGLGIEGRVRFLGFVPDPDLPGLYAAADLFVLPSAQMEGFGLVTIEALASGIPVVGTPVGATPEILCDIDRRLLASDVTPEGLRAAIERTLRLGPTELREIGAVARRRVAALYNAEWVGDALEKLLLGRASVAQRMRRRALHGMEMKRGPRFARGISPGLK